MSLQSLTKLEKSIQLMLGNVDVEIRLIKIEVTNRKFFLIS